MTNALNETTAPHVDESESDAGITRGTGKDGKTWAVNGPPRTFSNICLVVPDMELNYTADQARELGEALIAAADDVDGGV